MSGVQSRLGTLVGVMSDLNGRVVRRAARALVLAPAAVVTLMAAPAVAAPPEAWPQAEPVSVLDFLIVLLLLPLGLGLVIALLASVPAMARGEKYAPGQAWRGETTWFGGPKDGLEAADRTDPAAIESGHDDRGGASARW